MFGKVGSNDFVRKIFNINNLTHTNRLYSFLKLALDLTSQQELHLEIKRLLLIDIVFVPVVTVHECTLSFNLTSFDVLSASNLGELKNAVLNRSLREEDLMPFLHAARANIDRVCPEA